MHASAHDGNEDNSTHNSVRNLKGITPTARQTFERKTGNFVGLLRRGVRRKRRPLQKIYSKPASNLFLFPYWETVTGQFANMRGGYSKLYLVFLADVKGENSKTHPCNKNIYLLPEHLFC